MEQQESGVVSSGSNHGVPRGRWIIIAIVAVLGLSGVTAYYVMNKDPSKGDESITRTNVCKADTNKQAASFMNGNTNAVEYGVFTQKIKEMKGHDSDPNCLYILLQHNLAKNISKGNDTYMSRLEKVYDTNNGFSPEFGQTKSLQGLREQVASLKSINETHDSENEKMDDADMETLKYVDEADGPQ